MVNVLCHLGLTSDEDRLYRHLDDVSPAVRVGALRVIPDHLDRCLFAWRWREFDGYSVSTSGETSRFSVALENKLARICRDITIPIDVRRWQGREDQ